MKKRLVLLMALSLTFAFPAAVMAEDTTAAEETADDTEAADSTAEDADVKSEGVMTHDEYLAAAVDDEVTIETYVQAKQSWWEDKATFYTQDKDGAYFIYNMPCSEEDYEKLVPGTKIKVTGYKAEWSGEIEVADVSSFEIEDGEYIAEPLDVTDLLGKDELIDHQNELVSFKGMTVEAAGSIFSGGNAVEAAIALEGAGAVAVGINCSVGPDQLVSVVRNIKENVSIPVIAKPNAGMPTIDDQGNAIYSMDAKSFAEHMKVLIENGASVVGGCCGTTPEFIREISRSLGR